MTSFGLDYPDRLGLSPRVRPLKARSEPEIQLISAQSLSLAPTAMHIMQTSILVYHIWQPASDCKARL